MQNKYGALGLQIIGISMDDTAEPVHEFYKQFQMNYPVVLGNAKLGDAYGGILGLPVTFLIDREGKIHSKHIGETDAAVVEQEVTRLLNSPSQ
jgi:peroxiredoxin